ncbi:MAG: pilus assembly protein PilP [Thermoanaerobaculum sp.]|nr:pilus assembly protein PilP [Thermoanaerobaculum sp.]MDW7968712.1 hypothetical protein [Thermoanaerobaculum sp.]
MKAIILFLLGLFSAVVFWAQALPQQRPPAEKPIDTSTVERILAGEEEVAAGGGFSYDPAGRRDPFRSLLAGRSREEIGQRPPGLPGMGVEEIKLQGIIKLPEGFIALIQGTDNLSYIIKPGTVLYDGTVEKIEPGKVTFKVNVADPRSLKPYREVVRTLQ